MNIQKNVPLSQFTSFATGGPAENLVFCRNCDEIAEALADTTDLPLWILGYGSNVLISDAGLPGTTVIIRKGEAEIRNGLLIADAGMWWDDLVQLSLQNNLWGIELMSGIPSSVGGAISGNIAAYGQQVSDTLEWIEACDTSSMTSKRLAKSEIDFHYRSSSLQSRPNLVITKAAFKLSQSKNTELHYESALLEARKLNLDTEDLNSRRQIILAAREKAGSLYDPNDPSHSNTAGSFFKNPKTDIETAKKVATFDETGKAMDRVLEQNRIHGGDETRVSASHVLLAAGFNRGQTWGPVRIHPEHVLKLENTGSATSQQIYDVQKEIVETVKTKLGITLEPEVKFLGNFA